METKKNSSRSITFITAITVGDLSSLRVNRCYGMGVYDIQGGRGMSDMGFNFQQENVKKEHSPFHKMVVVSYRDGEYAECAECDFTEKI